MWCNTVESRGGGEASGGKGRRGEERADKRAEKRVEERVEEEGENWGGEIRGGGGGDKETKICRRE